jgi:hypothetical protein
MDLAVENDLVIRLRARPGDFVVQGGIVAHVWKSGDLDPELLDEVREVFVLGRSRSLQQDAEFGIVQLVEVAVRALSTGLNDPFTAMNCVDRISSLLCRLSGRAFPRVRALRQRWPPAGRGRHVVLRRIRRLRVQPDPAERRALDGGADPHARGAGKHRDPGQHPRAATGTRAPCGPRVAGGDLAQSPGARPHGSRARPRVSAPGYSLTRGGRTDPVDIAGSQLGCGFPGDEDEVDRRQVDFRDHFIGRARRSTSPRGWR